MSNRDTSVWITEKIKKSLLDDVCKTGGSHFECHPWSLIKLIVLGQWANVYTTVMFRNRSFFRYVDLLAGSGTSFIMETKDIVAGSVFVAKAFARRPFTSYVLVEEDFDRCNALEKRAKSLGCNYIVRCGDCNKFVDEIFADKTHSFVFIDNQGYDVTWKSIETILKAPTDILINFPTAPFSRTADPRTASSLNEFFGYTSWMEAIDREDALKIYKQKLERRFRELREQTPYVSDIRVGTTSYFYDLVLVCRKNGYTNAWEDLKKKTYWKDPDIAKNALDFLKGRTTRLDQFINEFNREISRQNKPAKQHIRKETKLTKWFNEAKQQ